MTISDDVLLVVFKNTKATKYFPAAIEENAIFKIISFLKQEKHAYFYELLKRLSSLKPFSSSQGLFIHFNGALNPGH